MKLLLFVGLILISAQQNLPFKPNEDFEIKLKYEFKQRATPDANSVHLSETIKERERRTTTAMLPYVGINLRLIKLGSDELKVRIIDNTGRGVYNRKVKPEDVVFINMGFTDDMKDRVTPHQYIAYFLNDDKKEVSRIVITVNEDGTFLVNEEKRGKF